MDLSKDFELDEVDASTKCMRRYMGTELQLLHKSQINKDMGANFSEFGLSPVLWLIGSENLPQTCFKRNKLRDITCYTLARLPPTI